jgi:Holliday junction resolvase RusA-like endonuclease
MLVSIQPVPKPRMTRSDKWKKRPCVLAYRAFADELRLKVRKLPESPFKIIFHIHSPIAKRDGTPHTFRPDGDNLTKSVLDSLWPNDDAHLWSVWFEKRWTLKPSHIELVSL